MAKKLKLKRKDTKIQGHLLDANEGHVSSFMGSINEGPTRPYIEVEIENDWLSLSQAKRLVDILNTHIERIELSKGAGITTGSRSLSRKTRTPKGTYVGYNEGQMYKFLDAVEELADKHFNFCENHYKWKVLEGEKSTLHIDFEMWLTSVKDRTKKRKAKA